MNKLSTLKIWGLSSLIITLIIAKVTPVLHLQAANGYWDVDRAITLLAVVTFFHFKVRRVSAGALGGIAIAVPAFIFLDAHTTQAGWERIIQLLILTSLVEEILLRATLYELLLRKLTPITVLLSTSLLFATVHPQAHEDLAYGATVFATGLLLGATYLTLRDRGIDLAVVASTILHMGIIMIGLHLNMIQ